MGRGPEVDRWFAERRPPAAAAMQRVREVILKADPRMTEYVKYGTVQFASEGDLANFVQHGAKTVTVMFNRGARIKGKFVHLEGDGPSARFMRFKDGKEVTAHAMELTDISKTWCAMTLAEKGNK